MLLNITSEVAFSNFEEFLKIHNIRQNGIYISNAFIISNSLNINTNNQPVIILLNRSLQTSRTYIHQASVNTTDFITLTPPGIGLCKVFEYLSCETFSKISLEKFASIIPFILIKGTKFTEDAQILLDKDTVTIKLSGTSSNMAIQETTDQSRTSLIGCLVSSALACALAKVIGKPIIIESQSLDTQENSLKIVYRILEKI
jgi:hypothetical protein